MYLHFSALCPPGLLTDSQWPGRCRGKRSRRGGLLSPWPQWFGGRRPRLIRDTELDQRLYDACPWTPWPYLEEPAPAEWAWMDLPHAYLHTDPDTVAEAIVALS